MNELVEVREAANERMDAAYRSLRQRFVEGRITLSEFEEEVGKVYSARVHQEPRDPGSWYPSSAGVSVRSASSVPSSRVQTVEVPAQVRVYVLVMAMLIGIWAVTGMGYFWPIWPMMGWGIGIVGKALGVPGGCHSHRTGRGQHARSYGGHYER